MEERSWMRELSLNPKELGELKKRLDAVNERNYRIFGLTQENVQLASKVKRNYIQQNRRKATFQDRHFCTYTDNIDHKDEFIYPWATILTVHGNPGNEREWNFLESEFKNKCRFINFVVPGYDGESEIRGNYGASWYDCVDTIKMLLDYLKISKVYFCGHSMGSMVMYNFVLKYPERLDSIIMMAGAPNRMYIGLTVFDTIARIFFMEKLKGDKSKMNIPDVRTQFCKEFNEMTRDIYFQVSPHDKKAKFPILSENEIGAWVKMIDEEKPQTLLRKVDQMSPEVLKFILFSKNDPLADWENYYYTTDCILKNSPILFENEAITKEEVAKILKCNPIDLPDSMQELFLIMFEKGGHQIHVRHGKVLANMIEQFIQVTSLNNSKKLKMKMKPNL